MSKKITPNTAMNTTMSMIMLNIKLNTL